MVSNWVFSSCGFEGPLEELSKYWSAAVSYVHEENLFGLYDK